jgi:hypothetical protein
MKLLLSIIPFLVVTSVVANPDKSAGGLAASLGFGGLYGGAGIGAEYQFPIQKYIRIVPLASICFTEPIYGAGNKVYGLGYCVGVNAEFGRFHRFFIGPSFGSQYLDYDVDPQQHYSNLNVVVGPQ